MVAGWEEGDWEFEESIRGDLYCLFWALFLFAFSSVAVEDCFGGWRYSGAQVVDVKVLEGHGDDEYDVHGYP